jgi:hypothetical protein
VVVLWTSCREQASDYEEKRNSPGVGKCRELQKMKNSGNEAKNYLKTKHITFFDAANYARFACKSARIAR